MSKNIINQVFLRVTSLSVNNITINAPQNVTYSLTLPLNTGFNNQLLVTDGIGNTTWQSVSNIATTGGIGGCIYIHSTTAQVISTSTFTPVSFSSPVTSSQGNPGITNSAGTFVNDSVSKTVLIVFTAAYESNSIGVRMAIIKVNGTDVGYTRSATCTNTNSDAQTTCVVRLPANGVISFTAWQNSGIGLNTMTGTATGIRASVTVLQF